MFLERYNSMALLLLALTMHWMSAPMAAAQNLGDYAAGAPGAAARPNATASDTSNNTVGVNSTASVDSLQEVPVQLPETTTTPETTTAPTLGVPAVTLAPSTRAPEPTTKSPTFAPEIETASPTVAATTKRPWTGRPTTMPTLGQTTSSPTIATPPPVAVTAKPTAAPSKATMAPSVKTDAPTDAPSMPPTTVAPTMTVTTAAPTAPTNSPTDVEPTAGPTLAPTGVAPTTKAPSMMPTSGPTAGATEAPTLLPTVGTSTLAPTFMDVTTGAPTTETPTTESPTTASGTTPVLGTLPGLEMTLVGMNSLMDEDAKADWVSVTNDHIKGYFTRNAQLGITDVVTNVQVIQQNIISVERRRQLQLRQPKLEPEDAENSRRLATASIFVQYQQELAYSTADADRDTLEVIALAPFQTLSDIDDYVASLKDTNVAFSSVQRVQDVGEDTGGPPTPSVAPITGNDDDKGGMSTGAIIGIVVGCVGALLLVGGVGYFVSQRGDDGGYVTTGKTPPNELDVASAPDEVSTLAEPHTIRNSGGIANTISGDMAQSGSGGGYGDQSVATVDYDYSKAYGGGGDTSVSSAGGTFGSRTHTDAAGGAATVSMGGTASGASGPVGGETGSQFRGQNASVREELIDIYAPPGKLGVVIDTPDDGAPVVHAVKDSSVIADKLQVGDKLVAVDDEDVRSMTAIKVSKLISRKSANASRKLSIIRTVVVDE